MHCCCVCGKDIHQEAILIRDAYFHTECFACSSCGKQLTVDSCVMKDVCFDCFWPFLEQAILL